VGPPCGVAFAYTYLIGWFDLYKAKRTADLLRRSSPPERPRIESALRLVDVKLLLATF
jgi:hypothetical protein